MSSQSSSVPIPKSAATRLDLKLRVTLAVYGLLLLVVALWIPLRIPEVLQMAAANSSSFSQFFGWIAQAPASAPLYPLAQLPFLLLAGHSRLAARLSSLLFAVAASYLFLRLAKRLPLERPYWALLLFMLLPVHFELSWQAKPLEQALFLTVLSTECFFRLLSRPGLRTAFLYAGCLTLCLYTDRDSFLPAAGYLLFLFRFVNRAQEQRALWYALAATAAPVLVFIPYAWWAHTQVSADWLNAPPWSGSASIYLRAIRSVATERWAAYLLAVPLSLGVLVAAGRSFYIAMGTVTKRIRIFILAGGVLIGSVAAMALDMALGEQFSLTKVLCVSPAIIILLFTALEWPAKRANLRPFSFGVATLIIAVCAVADAEYLLSAFGPGPHEDLQTLAASVPGELHGDSCVVFVSQRFSQALFLVFEPELQRRECLDFFHSRIVLASHPYVTPDQQQDAESYFRGLNYTEVKRVQIGGGQVVVLQQNGR